MSAEKNLKNIETDASEITIPVFKNRNSTALKKIIKHNEEILTNYNLYKNIQEKDQTKA